MSIEQGDKSAILLLKAIEEPSKYLATIQIGISLIGLFSGAFAANTFTDPIVAFLIAIHIPLAANVLKPGIFLFITVLLSYFILVFGELIPKRIGMQKSFQMAKGMIKTLDVFSKIAAPFVSLLSVSTDFILKLLGIDTKSNQDDVTEEEIRMMVESGSEHGNIAISEHEMINNIFEFNNKTAEDACIHRMDVVALSVDAEHDELIKLLTSERFSRIPVYGENIDDILGVLHLKDMMKYLVAHDGFADFDLRKQIRPPYFVPFSKKTHELFEEMQKKRDHMAIVIDEYGGTLGIITMEDLVEEIMGNIFDEHDVVELPDITPIDDNTFVINGTTDLEVVADFFDVTLPTEDYDTLSGFLIGQLGNIPAEYDKPELVYSCLLFKVDSVLEKRIATIIVSRTMVACEEGTND